MEVYGCHLPVMKGCAREKLSLFVWARGIDVWAEVTWAKFCSVLTISTVRNATLVPITASVQAGGEWSILSPGFNFQSLIRNCISDFQIGNENSSCEMKLLLTWGCLFSRGKVLSRVFWEKEETVRGEGRDKPSFSTWPWPCQMLSTYRALGKNMGLEFPNVGLNLPHYLEANLRH